VYRLTPAKPPEQTKPAPPLPEDEAIWFSALEGWAVDPSSWDVAALGPPLDQAGSRVPDGVRVRFVDRQRKRAARRKEAEAAAARRSADDAELRSALLNACNGNYSPALLTADLAPVKMAIELVGRDRVRYALLAKVDKRSFPGNAPLVSWSEE